MEGIVNVDSLGWPLLSTEEREFLEDRGFKVTFTAINSQIAFVPKRGYYMQARAVLDFCLKPWGGDPVFRSTTWRGVSW